MKIKIINYGAGNLKSIANIISKVGGVSEILDSPDKIHSADAIILPGVGSFDYAIENLDKKGWRQPLYNYVMNDRKPILGLCLGMQVMTRSSEEGTAKGFGFIQADTVKFSYNSIASKKIPHMGWNNIKIEKKNRLFDAYQINSRFYFCHSYHVVCDNTSDVLTTSNYGYNFVSSFQKKNIFGVQFHPEKSHKYGYLFFKNIINLFNENIQINTSFVNS